MRSLILAALTLLSTAPLAAEEAARLVGQLYVRGDGLVEVEAEALARLGAPSAAHVEVRRRGQPVARWTHEGALRFEARDTASAHTVHAVYRLWVHADPQPAGGPPPRPEGPQRYTLDEDRYYGALASARHEVYAPPAPVWYLAGIPPSGETKIELRPEGIDATAALTLEAEVRTAHKGEVAVRARWGEQDLGTARAPTAAAGARLAWQVPAGAVAAEGAELVLGDASPPIPKPPPRDVSAGRGIVWVDALAVVGPTAQRAPTPRVVRPVPFERVPDPLALAGDARHVVIAVPALEAAARRLAEHRSATGTPSAVVPVTSVYERYGFGEHTAQAIRAFVLDLRAREDAPLDYLLLAGDATFDRTDRLAEPTIPTLMARTMYNGATAADLLYVVAANGEIRGSPPLGRLPFREAQAMEAYVDRVIRYETRPPADATRRLFRFVTSEARFGPQIDRMIENKFRSVLTEHIAPAFDIEGTYASVSSPFLWPPPEFNEKVLADLNAGSLFFTYVGHGFAEGFDTLRVGEERYRILHVDDVGRVAIEGTHPIVFVLACTTAQFDAWKDGVGEALLQRPEGPVAFWGASRICHPAFNAVMGQAIAMNMARPDGTRRRLGRILAEARDAALEGRVLSTLEKLALRMFLGGAKLEHLAVEGSLMYALLGDPALKVAFPQESIAVAATVEESDVVVRLQAELPAQTVVHVSLELPRNRNAGDTRPVANPADPASFPAIRAKHARMNDWALVRSDAALQDGRASVRLPLGAQAPRGLVVKAWAVARGDVHQGATVLP